jgi:hypothetical protein
MSASEFVGWGEYLKLKDKRSKMHGKR